MKIIFASIVLLIGIVLPVHSADNRAAAGIDTRDCICVQDKNCPCKGYGENRKDHKKQINARKKRGKGVGIFREGMGINIPEEIPKNMSELPYEYACGSNEDGSTMMCQNW